VSEKLIFNGSDYKPEFDNKRLSQQHIRVKKAMLNKGWRTLSEIASITGDPESSISAQLRHLRKPRFGSYCVEKRARGNRQKGLFEYRLIEQDKNAIIEPKKTRKNKYRDALIKVWESKYCSIELKEEIRKFFHDNERK
jgi:hypothetical protein